MFILLSFFGSTSHHFMVHRVDISFIQGFSEVRSEFVWGKVSVIEADIFLNKT